MKLLFSKLEQAGFEVQITDDGVEIHPVQGNDAGNLANAMSKRLQSAGLTDIEHDTVIEAAVNSFNRILISKAIV